jgi:hypothetical protein
MATPETRVSQVTREPLAMQQLRACLERLPVELGYSRVWLHPIYNAQYDSVSIVCWGGTLEQQQRLIATLGNPPADRKPTYQQVVSVYSDTSNPQINFNSLADAITMVDAFAGPGQRIGVPGSVRGAA